MNSDQQGVHGLRCKLQALVEELEPLAEKYEQASTGALRMEDPLITKAKELIVLAQTPTDKINSLIVTSMEATMLRTLIHLNAIQSIPESGSISLADLSVKTNIQASLLERLLRLPVDSNLLAQDPSTGEYSHTHLSLDFINPDSIASRTFPFFYDSGLTSLHPLHKYLTDQHEAIGKWEEPGASRDSTRFNPETWHAGVEGQRTAFEVMESDPERMARFQKMMYIAQSMNPYVGYYDFDKLALTANDDPDREVLVDVGGGQGFALSAILSAHTSLKPTQCVLQDTAPVISLAKTSNPANLPPGVTSIAHDFFTPQPIPNAKAYYLKAIAHDLSDANLVKVLQQIVPVMASDSKVLIAENVLPERGVGGWLAFSDLSMMSIGGKERTEEGFREVCEKAGLKVDWVYRVGGGRTYAIVEASLKE